MTFEELQEKYSGREPAFPSHLEKPNNQDLNHIQKRYACTFPDSFIQFQLVHCHKTPMGEMAYEGFGWANKKLEPYLNLEEIVKDYRQLKFPTYLSPFRIDNGDYWCFDTRHPDDDGEFPVVVWSHNDNDIEQDEDYRWENFIDWLDKTMDE